MFNNNINIYNYLYRVQIYINKLDMSITLNNTDITIDYRASNFNMDIVKSDIYIKDTNLENNILNEPQIIPEKYNIEQYIHLNSGNFTEYTKSFTQNTLCDILIVGGGGGGDRQIGGGGGGGAVLYATNVVIPSGTYIIKVGAGGAGNTNGYSSEAFGAICLGGGSTSFVGWGTPNNGTSGGSGSGGSAGSPSTTTAIGGTIGVSTRGVLLSSGTLYNGNVGGNGLSQHQSGYLGSGGGGGAGSQGLSSVQTQYTTRSSWIAAGKPSKGGDGVAIDILGTTYYWGAGGGGSGHYSHAGDGGLGGGGGGGGDNSIIGLAGTGGINSGINGLNTGIQNGGNGAPNTGSGGGGGGYNGNSTTNNGGAGGSGIVIIKYRDYPTLEGNPVSNKLIKFSYIPPPLVYDFTPYNTDATWKAYATSIGATTYFNYFEASGLWHVPENGYIQLTLPSGYNMLKVNYNNPHVAGTIVNIYIDNVLKDTCQAGLSREYIQSYTTGQILRIEEVGAIIGKNLIITLMNTNYIYNFNPTKSVEYQTQLKTGVGGWRIVRYLPPNLGRWYEGNNFTSTSVNSTNIGTAYNYTNEWGIPFGTFDEMFFATFDMTYWLRCLKTSVQGTYANDLRPIISSSSSSTSYSARWYQRDGELHEPWVSINDYHAAPQLVVYVENSQTASGDLRNAYGGMCVLVRDSATGTTISNPNTYTLNFPVPTIADINNNSNIVLRGAYDIALSTSNALIIPKEGQYIPKPTTFTNYAVERMYPPVRNFTAATTTISGQTYGNGTYVVSYSSYHETFQPFKCFNTSDTIGGHWVDNYTNGNYNGSANIVSGYLGDWLKIQLPVAIKLTRFSFVQRTDIPSRSPKDFKIYGSNDNITWVELINKTDAIYNASYIYEKTTPEITNTYTYYGLVVNKLLAGQYNTVLNFDEWYIYGQEPSNSLSIRYNILNPILDPIGAQWTYNTSNTNVYHMGRVGIGTTSPEYQIDVSGTLNAKAYYFNGVQIGRLSEGMVANVQHLTYTHMEVKNNTGWDAINDDLTTGFVISITPKSNLSKILVNLIAHIGLTTVNDARWWGIKLYRKIGTAAWAEVTGSNGTETGSAATTAGTPVWISHNMGTTTASYAYQIINLTGTYLDYPNTTSTVYYTAYWNQRMGDNPSGTGELWLNRAANQNDAYRPAPSSSWTLKEIWYG